MRPMLKTSLGLAVIALVGCDDGLSGSTKMSELSAAEQKEICLELAADYPEKTVSCGDGFTLTVCSLPVRSSRA